MLTFEEWRDIWDASGKWLQRGLASDQYRLVRIGGKGAFEAGNVHVCRGAEQRGPRNIPRHKFTHQRAAAKKRGIPFLLTFEEWWDIWQASGKWEERGRSVGQYVMARYNDTGPYSVGNVHICTCSTNITEGQIGTPLRGWARPEFNTDYWSSSRADEERERRRAIMVGNKYGLGPKPDHMRAALSKTTTGRRRVVRDGRRTWAYPGDDDYPGARF